MEHIETAHAYQNLASLYSQQGLNLSELEAGNDGKLMYPYSGKTFEYWPNGDIKVRGRLRDGLRNGKWEYFHTNGSKMAVGKYYDGDGSDIGEWMEANGYDK